MTATAFALWVLIAGAPPYERGTYHSFSDCVEAARSQVESLEPIEGRPVRWQCIPIGNDADAR